MPIKLFALALAAAQPGLLPDGEAASAQLPVAAVDTDQLLLFAVQLDNATLTESLTAYGDPADPLVPLGELARLLDLPLDVQPGAGLVTGRLGENQRAITVDLAAHKALVGGKVILLIPPDSKVTASDIYLRASLVAKLLPLRIASSPDEMVLSLTATEKLPIQARGDRTARLSGLTGEPTAQDDALHIATPYRWVSRPAFDFGMELGADSGLNHPVTRFEGRVAGDLAETGFTGWVATNDAGRLSSARVTATRRDAEGNMLGPLNATYAAAGDVYSPALPLGPRSAGGAGVVVSSARVEDTSVFQRINLRGELPIGYDVELYVNDILRNGQQGAKTQGRYDFTDVPLVRGRNVIRIVLYGPRGERSEQTRVINVGGGQLAAGQTVVDAGIVAQDKPLIPLSNDDLVSFNRSRGALRAVVNVAHGLTPRLTVSTGLGIYSDYYGERREVLTAGLRTSLLGMALQGDFAHDLKGGSAASLSAASRIGGISFLGRHVEYAGVFNDEANSAWSAGRPMRRYSELTFDLAVPLPGVARLPFSGRIERAEFADGGTSFSARGRTTASLAGTLVALGADYSRRTGPGYKTEQFNGSIAASRFIDYKWQLRTTAEYRLKPNFRLETLGATADRAINDRYSLRLGASRSFTSRDITLQTGMTARLPFAEATLGGDWSTSQQRWRVGLQLNFGLAFDPLRGGYRVTPPGPANGGSATFQAFIDNNANGVPDQGEAPVPGVELQGTGRKAVTDANGRAFVTGLGESAEAMLHADTSNTDTVFVTSPPQNIMFAPRAGKVATVLYPMVPSSELVIKLNFRQQNSTMTGLSAVHVRLIPSSGSAIAGTTEFDGTAVFDGVKPGSYRIELDSDQAARLGMRLVAPMAVTIGTDGRTQTVSGEVLFIRSSHQ